MESRLQENLKQKHENYIFPFFWQYEDGCQFMEEELEKIYESGAGAVCVESRHHPDYCGKPGGGIWIPLWDLPELMI